jgi:hypothetical protein
MTARTAATSGPTMCVSSAANAGFHVEAREETAGSLAERSILRCVAESVATDAR